MPCGAPTPASISISATVGVLLTALVYWRGWHRLPVDSRDASSWRRLAMFISGMVALWIAVGSPLATMDHSRLTFHMVQHLVLMTIAAPLILLGEPVTTLRRAIPNTIADQVVRPLSRHLRGLGRILTHPVSCWVAGTGVVIAWHVPFVFELGMHSQLWHAVQHASFLAGGLLFWCPVIQPWPVNFQWQRWSIPLYLFFATLPCDALSAFLAFCGRVVYPSHAAADLAASALRLHDQEFAGALMWCWVTFAYLIPAIGITLGILGQAAPIKVPPKMRLPIDPHANGVTLRLGDS